jgi:hypothetical protein
MDPGFRRGDGRERATKAATPSLWRVGYPRNTPQLMVVESARARRDSLATSPLTAFPAKAGTQEPGVAHLLHGRAQPHTLAPRLRGGSGDWEAAVFIDPLIPAQAGIQPTIQRRHATRIESHPCSPCGPRPSSAGPGLRRGDGGREASGRWCNSHAASAAPIPPRLRGGGTTEGGGWGGPVG